MNALAPSSLAAAIDNVNEAFFSGRALSLAERRCLAKWISGRQGLAGSYAEMPAPTSKDFQQGIRFFTGERVNSRAGTAHILGEEACRALILLNVTDKPVQAALDRATAGLVERLKQSRLDAVAMGHTWYGGYCCTRCSCALWRHMAAGGLRAIKPDEWLDAGLRYLRADRTSDGRWSRFPFYYTLLALSEMESRQALAELRHAARSCERLVNAPLPGANVFVRRRRALAQRVLERI